MTGFHPHHSSNFRPYIRSLVGRFVLFGVLGLIAMHPTTASAYVGPGAGITMIAALGAVVFAIVLSIVGIFLWPIRAFLRRRKRQDDVSGQAKENREE